MPSLHWSTPERRNDMGAPLPLLANEIYLDILDFIQPFPSEYISPDALPDTRFESESDLVSFKSTLSNISLVCRFFCRVAQPRLFHTLYLSGKHLRYPPDSSSPLPLGHTGPGRFLATLSTSASAPPTPAVLLSPFVRSLTISRFLPFPSHNSRHLHFLYSTLSTSLPFLSSLHTLDLKHVLLSSSLLRVLSTLPSLQALSIVGCVFDKALGEEDLDSFARLRLAKFEFEFAEPSVVGPTIEGQAGKYKVIEALARYIVRTVPTLKQLRTTNGMFAHAFMTSVLALDAAPMAGAFDTYTPAESQPRLLLPLETLELAHLPSPALLVAFLAHTPHLHTLRVSYTRFTPASPTDALAPANVNPAGPPLHNPPSADPCTVVWSEARVSGDRDAPLRLPNLKHLLLPPCMPLLRTLVAATTIDNPNAAEQNGLPLVNHAPGIVGGGPLEVLELSGTTCDAQGFALAQPLAQPSSIPILPRVKRLQLPFHLWEALCSDPPSTPPPPSQFADLEHLTIDFTHPNFPHPPIEERNACIQAVNSLRAFPSPAPRVHAVTLTFGVPGASALSLDLPLQHSLVVGAIARAFPSARSVGFGEGVEWLARRTLGAGGFDARGDAGSAAPVLTTWHPFVSTLRYAEVRRNVEAMQDVRDYEGCLGAVFVRGGGGPGCCWF